MEPSVTPPVATTPIAAATTTATAADYAPERALNSAEAVALSRRAREESKKSLKVDVKLTTAFVKKVSSISDDTAPGLIRDATDKLYLARYADEIALALVGAPIKLKDVAGCAALCSVMHRSYDEFTAPLLRELEAQFDAAVKAADGVSRRRVLFRWITELFLLGVLADAPVFLKALRALARAGCPAGPPPNPDAEPPLPNQACENLQALTGLVKVHAAVFTSAVADGFPPEPIPSRALALIKAYCSGAVARIAAERDAMRKLRRRIDEDNLKRGEAPESLVDALKRRQELCDELVSGANVLAEALGLPAPPPDVDNGADKAADELAGISLYQSRRGAEQELSPDAWVFGSEEARSFYMDLPDVASALSGKTEPVIAPAAAAAATADDNAAANEDDDDDDDDDGGDDDANAGAAAAAVVLVSAGRPVEELMKRLPDLLSVRAVDAFAMDVCRLFSKATRERLVQELLLVHWSRAELLPFHARLVAILSTVVPDVGPPLVKRLQRAYFRMLKDKKPGRLESRLRNAKYLGELVKFGLHCAPLQAPPAVAFLAVGQSLEYFQGDNIDAVCSLVETCGRELVRTPRTHAEMMRLLEALQRHRSAKLLGPRESVVDNAYFYCIPPDAPAQRRKARERPELEAYARYLLLERLNVGEASNDGAKTSECVRALMCLPWLARFDECEDAAARAVLASVKRRAACLPAVAQVVNQLATYHPHVAKRIVDDVIEAIELGLDQANPRQNQRRLGQARLLGQLLRFAVVSHTTVLDVLHMIVHRGHERNAAAACRCGAAQAARHHPSVLNAADPPYDGFRIRLACALLESGAETLIVPASRPHLLVFCKYLDRYVWAKQYVPIDVEICWIDTLRHVERLAARHGKLKLAGAVTSLAEAEEQVRLLEGSAVGGGGAHNDGLGTVVEEDETMAEESPEDASSADESGGDDGDNAGAAVAAVTPVQPEPALQRTAEDDEFDAEFAKLMKDTLDNSGRSHLVGAAAQGDNMTVPLGILKRSGAAAAPASSPGAVPLAFLKRGAKGKVEVRTLEVPADAALARSRKDAGESREEKDHVKQLVLGLVSTAKSRALPE